MSYWCPRFNPDFLEILIVTRPPDSDLLKGTPSLSKIAPARKPISPQAFITDSSSTKAVNFSSASATKRFPSPRCASAIKSFTRWNQSLRHSRNCNRLCSDCQRLFPSTSRVPKCGERILESRTSRVFRKFIYPEIAAVTGPILTFAPPDFFGTYSKNWPLPRSMVRAPPPGL